MHLVEQGAGKRGVQSAVIAPVEGVAHDARLQSQGGVVAGIGLRRVLAVEAKMSVVPVKGADQLAGIGVQQQLGGIETMAALGLPRAVRAQPINQARLSAWQIAVPDIAAVSGQPQPRHFAAAAVVKQAQIHGLCVG